MPTPQVSFADKINIVGPQKDWAEDVIHLFAAQSIFTSKLFFKQVNTMKYKWPINKGAPLPPPRAGGEQFVGTARGDVVWPEVALKYYGDLLTVSFDELEDTKDEQTRSKLLNSLILEKTDGVQKKLDYDFINGEGKTNPREMTGLKLIYNTTDTPGQVITAAPNGLDVTDSTNYALYVQMVTRALNRVQGGASIGLMNQAQFEMFSTALSKEVNVNVTVDEVNRPILNWHGVQFMVMDQIDEVGEILAFNEEVGTSTDCSSMYFIKSDARNLVGLAGSQVEMNKINQDNGYSDQTKFQIKTNFAVRRPRCVSRLEGIRAVTY